MKNCIVAQSGGPTSVINASAMGVVAKNKELKTYDKVFAGINGIEGILNKKIVNLSVLSDDEIQNLKYTPAAGLGSCRYKLKNAIENAEEYKKLFEILKEYEIATFFYIGGNDSMDTVHKLGNYAKEHGENIKFIGIPKTIDNDLPVMDHTPGFGSAAKYIATTVLENYFDVSVYDKKSAFILETMGRDTGWLAASAALATVNGNQIADFIYLPEIIFNKDNFIKDVEKKLKNQNQIFIVVSEGIKNEEGIFLSELSSATNKDIFGHTQLGGVGNYVKQILLDSGVISKARAVELSTSQRCAMHCASQTDIEESFSVGKAALQYSIDGENGYMIGIKRTSDKPYTSEIFTVDTSKVANSIKYFPKEWVNEEKNNVTEEAINYLLPLIQGEPKFITENGLPKYVKLENLIDL
jgi:ATP-dependent phosphofructokinase / diphosphate-dependent phosphofructokinase